MPRWALIVAVVVALIPAAWFTADRMVSGDEPAKSGAQSTDKPIPPVTTPSRTNGPSPSRTANPTKTTSALPRVDPDAPRRLTSGSVLDTGFDESVEPDGDRFTARTASEVSRWGSRGEPGSPGTDTVYVVGRTNTGAFADLDRLRTGSTVTIRTDNGSLGYTVSAVATLAENGLSTNPLFTAKVPGRLVLVGVRGGDYLVVTAKLSSATAS